MPGAGEGKEEPGLTREEQQVIIIYIYKSKLLATTTRRKFAGAGKIAKGGLAGG